MAGPAEGRCRARCVSAKQLIAIGLQSMAARQGKPCQALVRKFRGKTSRGLPRGILGPARNDV